MMTTILDSASDMDLVAKSLSGNRDAFGQIVSRYQNLICSLAYSATGNLSQSEDLAQETFLTAWKRLGDLREPAKLRAWLCGIARNLIHNALRRQGREPVHRAEELTTAHAEAAAPECLPAEQAISNEEQTILWRSLERIPEIYREPLVLYYREHQSIESVACNLDLSEDAVKQRLSRGRKLLQEEVAAVVEGALRRSAPGQAFAGAVLAGLPLNPGVIAVAGAGAGAAKGGGLLSVLALQLIGLCGSIFGTFWVIRNSKEPAERRMLKRALIATWLSVLLVIGMQCVLGVLNQWQHWERPTYYLAQAGNFWLFTLLLLTWQVYMFNHFRRFRLLAAPGNAQNFEAAGQPSSFGTHVHSGLMGLVAWCGFMVGGLGWLVAVAWQSGDKLASGIVIAVCLLNIAFPSCVAVWMGAARFKGSRLSFVPSALMFGTILLMVNWRLDLWIATAHGGDLAAAHQLLPMWIVHVGTLLILGWVAGLLMITKPKRA